MPRRTNPINDREKELVIALSRTPLNDGLIAHARLLIKEGIDWQSVLDRSSVWQVEPVVLGNLQAHFSQEISEEVRQQISQRERLSRAAAVTQTLRVVDIAKGLELAGVPTLVLKGPAIAKIAYDDVSRRTFSDIDLLVTKKDLGAAEAYLATRSYEPLFTPENRKNLVDGHHALEFSGPGPHIELHCALLPRYLHFDLGPGILWDEAITVDVGPEKLQTLAPHHLFLYLCAHGAKHEWLMFRWVCDVAQLAPRLTPQEVESVVTLAGKTGSKRIVALALRLVREVFRGDTAPSLSVAFATEQTDSLLAVAISRFGLTAAPAPSLLPSGLAGIHPYAEPLAFWIGSRERLKDRVLCGATFVFSPAPGDKHPRGFSRLLRPARLAANALRRAIRRG